MCPPTRIPWRPAIVRQPNRFTQTRTAYEAGKEPAMQCAESRCCVQCSLPCVGMWGLGSEAFASVAADDGDIAP